MLGYTLEEVIQLTSNDVIHPDDLAVRDAEAAEMFEGQRLGSVVHRRLRRKDGAFIRARVRKAVTTIDGEKLVVVHIEAWSDIASLEHAAKHDDLTGLLRRGGFAGVVETAALPEAATIAMVDVDGLKPVNDRLGHAAGDALLVHVAQLLAKLPVPGLIVGRWAGDEFVVCAPTPQPDEEGPVAPADDDPQSHEGRHAELLRSMILASAEQAKPQHSISAESSAVLGGSVSVGVTTYRPRSESLTEAIARADEDMYRRRASR